MGEDEEEAKRLLGSLGINALQEGAIAIKEMTDNLVKAGMTRWEALFWSAVHVAALTKFPDEEESDGSG